MTKPVKIKISAKTGSTGAHRKTWGVSISQELMASHFSDTPRVRLEAVNGDLLIHFDKDVGVLMHKPTNGHQHYYTSVTQPHMHGMALPTMSVHSQEVEGTYDASTNTIRVAKANVPPIVQQAIRAYNNLFKAVNEQITESKHVHEVQDMISEGKGVNTIGDHEALEAQFRQGKVASIPGANGVYTDADARWIKDQLESLLQARPDISITLELDGRVQMRKTVTEEI